MAAIYLVRHGETTWNREEIFRGQADIPLNDFGRRQAAALGATLPGLGLRNPHIVTSPLSRARETAGIIAASFPGSLVVAEQAFTDICFGNWEGKTPAEVAELYPALFQLWADQPDKVIFPGGESLAAVAGRTEQALNRMVVANPEEPIIIVSHRAVNKALLCRLLGLSLGAFWKLQQNTACLNELAYRNSSFILVRLNDTCHLASLGKDKSDF